MTTNKDTRRAGNDEREKSAFNDAKRRVLETLASAPSAMSVRELADGLGQRQGTIYGCCMRLRRQGLIYLIYDDAVGLRFTLSWRGRRRLVWLRRIRG